MLFPSSSERKMCFYHTPYISEENNYEMKLKVYWYFKCPRYHSLKLFESFKMSQSFEMVLTSILISFTCSFEVPFTLF